MRWVHPEGFSTAIVLSEIGAADPLVRFTPVRQSVVYPRIISCLLWPHWVFRPLPQDTSGWGRPTTGWSDLDVYRMVAKRSTASPYCLLSLYAQPATAYFGDSGNFLNCLPLGLPTNAQFLQQPWSGPSNKLPAAQLHWTQPHFRASLLWLSCKIDIPQLFSFICLIDGILPGDWKLNNEDTMAEVRPEGQIWMQIRDWDFRWKGKSLF